MDYVVSQKIFFVDGCQIADERLFQQIRNNKDHVLHQLIPNIKTHDHNLRKKTHNFILPAKDDGNFIIRLLFKNIY